MSKSIINKYDFNVLCAGTMRLLQNVDLLDKYSPFILTEYICYNDDSPNPKALRTIMQVLLNFRKAHNPKDISPVSFGPYLNTSTTKMKEEDRVHISNLFGRMKQDPEITNKVGNDAIFKMFLDYLKLLQIAKLSGKILENYNSGDPDSASDEMTDALNNIKQITISRAQEFNPKTIYSRLAKPPSDFGQRMLHLGGSMFDQRLGGFKIKTLNLFVGLTNTGKSQMAYHILRRCVETKIKAHITIVEDTEETFVERLVACLADLPIEVIKMPLMWTDEIHNKIKLVEQQITEFIAVDFVYGQSIDVVHKRKLDYDLKCQATGQKVPIVDIVDYTGHIAGKSFGDKKFEKMISAYTTRKDFALEHNKIVFDFAQVNRDGGKKSNSGEKSVLTITELAGAFDISHVCDTIISINRNEQDERNNDTRLHICKSRNGEKGGTFTYKVDFARARHVIGPDCPEAMDYGNGKRAKAESADRSGEENKFRDRQ